MKKKDSIIHIKLDGDEAIRSRKDVLNTGIDLIKIAQSVRTYRILRLKELQLKIELRERLREANKGRNKIKNLLPKVQIPKILKKHEGDMHKEIVIKELKPMDEEETKIESPVKKGKKPKQKARPEEKPAQISNSLEDQLKSIQAKLNSIE